MSDKKAAGKNTFRNTRNTHWDQFERQLKSGLNRLISNRIVSEEGLKAMTEKFNVEPISGRA